MIEITIQRGGGRYELRVKGHAEITPEKGPAAGGTGQTARDKCFGPPMQGQNLDAGRIDSARADETEKGAPARPAEWGNIVCAGCSAVVYSLMGALRNAPEHLDSLTTDAESGHAWVYCEGDAVVGALYRMAEIGLRQIARTHPEHVQVDVKSF